LKLQALTAGEKSAVAKIDLPNGDAVDVAIRFRPGVFTSAYLDRLGAADSRETAGQIAEALTFVDLEGDDGELLPVTGDSLYSSVPFPALMAILGAMQDAQAPGKKLKAVSSGSFAATDSDDD